MSENRILPDNMEIVFARPDRYTIFFVWGTWLAMVVIAFALISIYGRNIPLAEDWTLVAPLTGNEPDMLHWLWSQNNEHRVPLPRLIMLMLLKITNGDFRAGMVFNVIVIGLLAFAMIHTARAIRGTTSFTDAFFPLALLHIANWENLFWSWQLTFVVPIALFCGIFLVMVRKQDLTSPAVSVYLGVSLILLPLCGAIGLVFIPLMATWFIYCGWMNRQTRETSRSPKWTAYFLITASLIALGILGIYFIGYERPYWNPPSPGIFATLITTLRLLAMGFGSVARAYLLQSGIVALGILGTCALIAAFAVFQKKGGERMHAIGIFLFFANLALLALALGWGRAGRVPLDGIPLRYVLLSAPILCAAFLVSQRYGPPKLNAGIQWILLIVIIASMPLNTASGLHIGQWYRMGMQSFEQDLQNGVSASVLADRHREFLVHWWGPEQLEEKMLMLHTAKIGPFARMNADIGGQDSTLHPVLLSGVK